MSKQSLDQVIQRASTDARFKAQLGDNFEGAVRPYDLTEDEKARLASGLGLSGAAAMNPIDASEVDSLQASQASHVSATQASQSEVSAAEVSAVQVLGVDVSSVDES